MKNDWNKSNFGFETRSIHAGQEPDPTTGAIMTPVYLTSTFVQESPGRHKGYEYARSQNPTRSAYEACLANLKMVWIETPTNPTMKMVDIRKASAIAREHKIISVVDNTFMSPYFQRPLELGADVVVHSTTKYIGGHSDVVGGALIMNDDDLAAKIYFLQKSIGAICSPFDAYLAMRSLKTLALRMRQHDKNGREIAAWLEKHPKVKRVSYPGLASHPQHALAKEQMHGFGGMMTIYLKGGIEESRRLLESVKVFALAESLGGVESLIEHPAIMTHASIPAEARKALGIDDSMVRLSVGIENVEDLLKDLSQALDQV
ncbi:MAG: cystathionine gamma-synthase [Proteobacteria bacterium]|nr:MAG: cystathionine gamma-synthase [Pseudomonadota bacterium]